MSKDVTIHIEHKLHNIKTGITIGHGKAGINTVAHYGLFKETGEGKWVAVEKMVRQLRKLSANGSLAKMNIVTPKHFDQYEKFTIPGAVLTQPKDAPIDRAALKKANGDTSED